MKQLTYNGKGQKPTGLSIPNKSSYDGPVRFHAGIKLKTLVGILLVAMSSGPLMAQDFVPLPNEPGSFHHHGLGVSSVDGSTLGGSVATLRAVVGSPRTSQFGPAIWNAAGEVTPLLSSSSPYQGYVTALSDDGQVAAGVLSSFENWMQVYRPFRWTAVGGMTVIDLPPGLLSGWSVVMTRDGSVIAGHGTYSTGNGLGSIWRWTAGSGIQVLSGPPDFNGAATASAVTDISLDGNVIIGVNGGLASVFRWTTADGFQVLAAATPSDYKPRLSEDGNVVVYYDLGNTYRWDKNGSSGTPVAGGYTEMLPDAPGGSYLAFAGVSANGQTIVGSAAGPSLTGQPFRWTAGTGTEALGVPPGTGETAVFVSNDGTRVVGACGSTLWTWTEGNHYQAAAPLPTSLYVKGISGDGNWVFGVRDSTDGRGWRWSQATGFQNLSSPPECSMGSAIKVSGRGNAVIMWRTSESGVEVGRWTPSTGFLPMTPASSNLGDYASAISANGEVVVGLRMKPVPGAEGRNAPEIWRWTPGGGLAILGTPPEALATDTMNCYECDTYTDYVLFLSADGATIAGIWRDGNGLSHVFRWTVTSGFYALGTPGMIGLRAMSQDGRRLMGWANISGQDVPCVWVEGTGLQVIPSPASVNILDPYWSVYASADCIAVAGIGSIQGSTTGQRTIWRWTEAGGSENLGVLAGYSDPSRQFGVRALSGDGEILMGSVTTDPTSSTVRTWRWTRDLGFQLLPQPAVGGGGIFQQQVGSKLSLDGTTILGYGDTTWRWTLGGGTQITSSDFSPLTDGWILADMRDASEDGSVIIGNWTVPNSSGRMSQGWLAAYRPVIDSLSPNRATAGQGDLPIAVFGIGFESGARVFVFGTELTTTYVSPTQLQATIPSSALVSSGDFSTLQITVQGPTGAVSQPMGFTVMGSTAAANVDAMQTAVATSSTTATAAIEPATASSGGISATLTVTGEESASVTVATYSVDPSNSGNTSFEVAGQFLDLNASGVTAADSMRVFFYYPAGTPTEALGLKFWNARVSPATWENVTPATIDPLARRIEVVFDASSHPRITELDGTFFVPAVAPRIQFTGFLAPVGGVDAAGGSFAAPLRAFKAGSTIPLKFSGTLSGIPLTTGIHRLRAIKYSDATTSGTPIDATPQDAATTGNQFRFSDGIWQFNLDTKSTGLTKGIWQLVATLSEGSQHKVWIQIK